MREKERGLLKEKKTTKYVTLSHITINNQYCVGFPLGDHLCAPRHSWLFHMATNQKNDEDWKVVVISQLVANGNPN
jgi:hypothetical protein